MFPVKRNIPAQEEIASRSYTLSLELLNYRNRAEAEAFGNNRLSQ